MGLQFINAICTHLYRLAPLVDALYRPWLLFWLYVDSRIDGAEVRNQIRAYRTGCADDASWDASMQRITHGYRSRLSWLSRTPAVLRMLLLAPTRTAHFLHRTNDGCVDDYGPYCPCLRPTELCVTYCCTYKHDCNTAVCVHHGQTIAHTRPLTP